MSVAATAGAAGLVVAATAEAAIGGGTMVGAGAKGRTRGL